MSVANAPHPARPFDRELSEATAAAVEAGALIRAEFDAASGPRGSGDVAPVDTDAEQLIAARIRAAFPDDGFLGEETGSAPGTSGRTWVVDPNDGTRAFLGGHRGPAVSIALVIDGTPVLGVVYAYAAPDGDGDLITGALGHGVQRALGVTTGGHGLPPRECVVLVPLSGLRAPEAVAESLAPYRFRSVASIAYRLALAAAGEADAALSLSTLRSWDVAAGHALLRAAGRSLVVGSDAPGEEGNLRPFLYDAEGHGSCRRCFAGRPEVVEDLAQRLWERRPVAPAPEVSHPRHAASTAILSRAQGAWLGQLAGDALGSLVEFKSAADILRIYPRGPRLLADGGVWNTIAGQATDDSEMALALARSLVHRRGYDKDHVHAAYTAWARSGPFDMGRTTAAALLSRQLDAQSQANGALMRVSPIGLAASGPDEAARWAHQDASLTHPNPVTCHANAVFAAALSFAVREGAGARAVYDFALDRCRALGSAATDVEAALVAAADARPSDFIRSSGWVLIALQNAFFQLLHAETLEEGIVATAAAGGDTDTNAAIAGALLGAVHGRQAIPQQWARMVTSCRPTRASGSHVVHPRPEHYWPADALELAERLVAVANGAAWPERVGL